MIHFGFIVLLAFVVFLTSVCICSFVDRLPEKVHNLPYTLFALFFIVVVIWLTSYSFETVIERTLIATYKIVDNEDSVVTVAGRYSTPMVIYVDEANHFQKLSLTGPSVVYAENESSENYIEKYKEKIKFLCFYVNNYVYYVHLIK